VSEQIVQADLQALGARSTPQGPATTPLENPGTGEGGLQRSTGGPCPRSPQACGSEPTPFVVDQTAQVGHLYALQPVRGDQGLVRRESDGDLLVLHRQTVVGGARMERAEPDPSVTGLAEGDPLDLCALTICARWRWWLSHSRARRCLHAQQANRPTGQQANRPTGHRIRRTP
jgi:hypothetical protein